MQSKLETMSRWTLTIAILAAISMLVSLTLDFGGKLHVAIPLFVTFAATGVAASVGWVAVTCTVCINGHVDDRVDRRNQAVDDRIDMLADTIDELRGALCQFSECVTEYADQQVTTARLETIRSLSDTHASAGRDHTVTRIGRQPTRQTS